MLKYIHDCSPLSTNYPLSLNLYVAQLENIIVKKVLLTILYGVFSVHNVQLSQEQFDRYSPIKNNLSQFN